MVPEFLAIFIFFAYLSLDNFCERCTFKLQYLRSTMTRRWTIIVWGRARPQLAAWARRIATYCRWDIIFPIVIKCALLRVREDDSVFRACIQWNMTPVILLVAICSYLGIWNRRRPVFLIWKSVVGGVNGDYGFPWLCHVVRCGYMAAFCLCFVLDLCFPGSSSIRGSASIPWEEFIRYSNLSI